MAIESQVKGLSDLQKLLNQLPAKMENNVMRGALRAGANEIKKQAVINAPLGESGDLKESIKVGTKARRGRVTASVSAGKKTKSGGDAFYAHMVEYGTDPHAIKAKNGGALSFGGLFTKSIDHPGAKPKPFMRPAMDSKQTAALVSAGNYIKKRLSTKHGIDTAHVTLEGDE